MYDYDPRSLARFFEVHYWGHRGRVLIVHKDYFMDTPLVTELHVTRGDATDRELEDTTWQMAMALAEAANPRSDSMTCHDSDGSMELVTLPGMDRTVIRASPARLGNAR